jgi:Na+-translocating ferredoxin:NAD+ oxidoreductase RnfG subunit
MHKQQIQATLYQYFLILILLSAIAYRGGRDFFFQKEEIKVNVTLNEIQSIFPEASKYEINRNGVFDALDKDGGNLGSILLSTNYAKPYGYSGIVPILIGVDSSQIINKVVLLPNNETVDYVRAVYDEKFIGSWNGVKLEDAVQLKIDAVSGATHTSNAVIKGVRYSASAIVKSDVSDISQNSFWLIIKDILFLLLMLTSIFMVFKKGVARYRILYMFLVLVIMGLILNNALSVQHMEKWLNDGFTWRANWQTTIIFILALSISFLGKRKFYCNYLCPMGALQEIVNRFTPFKKRPLPTTYKSLSLREVYLILIAGALLLGFSPELSYAEPFMFFSFRIIGTTFIIFGSVVILLSLFFSKPWCSVCPTGCLLDTISYQKIRNKESK